MTTQLALRLPGFHVGCFSIAAISLTVITASGDDALDALVADYRAYELPMPSEQTKLAVLKWKTGTTNFVPQYRQVLALVSDAEEKDEPARHWIGCRQHTLAEEIAVTPTEPSLASLAKTQRIERTLEREGFGTYPDLAPAVQCAARGWDGLAWHKDFLRDRARGRRIRSVCVGLVRRIIARHWLLWHGTTGAKSSAQKKAIARTSSND